MALVLRSRAILRFEKLTIACYIQIALETMLLSILIIYMTKLLQSDWLRGVQLLSFIDLERGGFGEILHEVMIFPEGLCPEGNIITEGNISPNPPSGGSINDILYRKLKASKLRIKNLTHTFVNTMFYFRINASIVAFLSIRISFGILMTKPQVLGLKKPQVLGLKLKYSSLINTIYVLSAILLVVNLSRAFCDPRPRSYQTMSAASSKLLK